MSKVTVGEHIMKLNTDMSYIKKEVDTINGKLDGFIKNANEVYVNKQELSVLESRVNKLDADNVDLWKKLVKIGERLALLGALTFFLLRELGVSL